MRNFKKVISCAVGTTMLMPAASFAQADGAEEEANNDNVIIVTATKRASDVQDIPLAVTAVTPQQLERQGITDIKTLGAVSASFNLQSSQTESQGTSIRLRGVGTTGNNIGLESAVGVFIDGVYQSRPGIALGELVDVQQVEVLRGPQGTLFGRNTTAGALVVRNKAPDLGEFGGYAEATYGNFDLFNIQGAINAPLIQDQLGVRLTGTYRQRDGFVTNVADGSDSQDRDRFLLRGQLLWEPSPDISLKLIGDYQKTDENCCSGVTLRAAPLSSDPTVTPALFPGGTQAPASLSSNEFPFPIDRISNSANFSNDVEQWGVSGELNWDLGGAELTLIGSYRDFLGESRQDDFNGALVYSVSGNTFPAGTPPTFDDIKTWTVEGRLQGEAFDGVLDWLVGAFYSDESIVEEFALGLGPDYGLLADGFGVPLGTLEGISTAGSIFLDPIANTFDPTGGQAFRPIGSAGQFALDRFEQDGTSFSVFTHNIFNITDQLSITLGLRYVDDSKDASFNQLATGGDFCAASRALAAATGGNIAAGAANPLMPTPAEIGAGIDATNAIVDAASGGFIAAPAAGEAGIAGASLGLAGLNCFVFAAPADLSGGANPLTAGGPVEFADNFSDDEFIYTIQAAYEPNDDLLLYASFTHGYKAGGFNLDASAAIGGSDPRFASEEIDAYEIGIKSTLLDGRARANIALFYSDLADFQVLEFTGTQFQTFNVDDVSSRGVEVELFAQWNDYISNSFALTYTDANYGDDCDAPFVAAGGINPAEGLCGFALTNAPEWVGIFGMTYDGPINSSEWSMLANVNVRYESDRRTSTNPSNPGPPAFGLVPFDVQDANFKVNARLGFTAPGDIFTIEVWGRNLTDEVTRSITFNTPLVGPTGPGLQSRSAFLEEPRTYGVTVRGKF